MQFLDHPQLSRISAFLKELDVGDRLLSGRLELLVSPGSISAPTSVRHTADWINRVNDIFHGSKSIHHHEDSYHDADEQIPSQHTLRPQYKRIQDKKILSALTLVLSMCYPHHDFNHLDSKEFTYAEDFYSVYAAINYHLSFLAEVVAPGFLQDLWSSIRDAIDLEKCIIFSYDALNGQLGYADPYLDEEGCLFSFDYFFLDYKHEKVLYFSCKTKQKYDRQSDESPIESGMHSKASSVGTTSMASLKMSSCHSSTSEFLSTSEDGDSIDGYRKREDHASQSYEVMTGDDELIHDDLQSPKATLLPVVP